MRTVKVLKILAFSLYFLALKPSSDSRDILVKGKISNQEKAISCIIEKNAAEDKTVSTFHLTESFTKISNYLYKDLNFSPFFNVKNILDTPKMRQDMTNPFLGGGQFIKVGTDDKKIINSIFFDRKSKYLLVVGPGFGNEKEKFAPFVHMFSDYDIVIPDYRGHGYEQPSILDIQQWASSDFKPVESIINKMNNFICSGKVPHVNLRETTFGLKEEEDILAVVRYLKSKKNYKKVFGIGLCFSSYTFSKLAAKKQGLFSKLILDSSINSVQKLVDTVIESPELIIDPQKGNVPGLETLSQDSTILSNTRSFKRSVAMTAKKLITKPISKALKAGFSKVAIPQTTTTQYLSRARCPVLLIHGSDDLLTDPINHFYKNIGAKSVVAGFLFKNGRHLTNHIKHKEAYTMLAKLFFENDTREFLDLLQNPKKLIEHIISNMKDDLRTCN